jgi:hypothetical protein
VVLEAFGHQEFLVLLDQMTLKNKIDEMVELKMNKWMKE